MQELELTVNMIEVQLDEHPFYLDFSAEQFINRIKAIENISTQRKIRVTMVNFSNNKLKKIDQMNSFEKLQELIVTNNQLIDVSLKIESLIKLDVSFNKLSSIPDFGLLKHLRILNLSNNLIGAVLDQELQQISAELQEFYINNNLIKFKQIHEIKNIIDAFKRKPYLRILDISKNPFILKVPAIENQFALIPTLEFLNGKTIDYFEKNEDEEVREIGDESLAQSEFDEQDDTKVADELNYRIQICINDPTRSIEQLKKIQELVNRITENPAIVDQYFQNKNPEIQMNIQQNLESFLQQCFLFAQNQRNYLEEILKALAQLAIVQHLNFGRRCFEVVVELVRSGPGLTSIAKTILRTYSIPLIQQQKDIQNIPTFVLEGILRTIQEREEYDVVPEDMVYNFQSWLDQIIGSYRKINDSIREDIEYRDVLCLNFIAEIGNSKPFAKRFRECKILSKCIILFSIIIHQDMGKQYIAVLKILNNCANADYSNNVNKMTCGKEILNSRETAYNFVKYVEDELRGYLFMFKKFRNSLVNPETKENKELVNLRYEKVEMLISVYGAICQVKSYQNKDKKKSHLVEDLLISELLILATVPAIHPYLVNGISIFIRKLLENREMHAIDTDASTMVKYISNKIQNGVPLLQYLGGDFYEPMMKQLDATQQKLTKNLASLMNVKVHMMFMNIVKIFEFYSKNAIDEKSPIADICLEVSANLNNQGRDQALFLALATPSDMVRLSIVQCLLTIKVTELDSREVGKLVNLLGSYKNLGAGQTESVISNIMMIVARIVLGEKTDAQDDFITVYSENCTLDALDILVRNQERDLRKQEDENEEKIELSFGVVNFLKTLQKHKILKRNLKGVYQANCLKRSLLCEEMYIVSTKEKQFLDIEIERTYIGKQSSYLINTLFGKDSLYPYRRESDRVLLRMAENLENRPEDIPEDLNSFGGLYNFEKIKKHWLTVSEQRKKQQLDIWDFMKKFENPPKLMDEDPDTVEYFKSQHQLFYSQDAAVNLLGFLFGRNNSTKTMQLKEHFQEFFTARMNYDRTIQSIALYIQDTVDDYRDLLEQGVQKKMLSVSKRDEHLDCILRGQHMPTDPLRGFAKEFPYFNPNKVILFPMQKSEEKDDSKMVAKNVLNRDEVLYGKCKQMINPEDRVVTVAVYLRIVYALLDFGHLGQEISQQLAKKIEYLRELTLICEWADWRLGNIGIKYLKIVNYILKNAQACSEQSFMTGFFIFTKAVRDMLDDISLKLKNEDKNPLKYEDIYLIKETCECMFKIANSISVITYFDKIKAVIDTFMNDVSDSEKEQALITIDQKVDEYIISQVMPIYAFTVFIEIMVWDMQQEKQLSASSVNNEKIFKIKQQMRKYLIKLIGLYIIKCRGQKQQILQAFNKLEVFDKKFIRQSFMQEILDEQYFFDYSFVLEKAIQEKKLFKYDDYEGNIQFFCRCFFKQRNNTVPALAIISGPFFIVVEVEEDIIRKKSKEFKIWQDSFQQIKFKKFNVLLKLNISENIEGFFRMECEQRICVVYSKNTIKPFVYDEKSLEYGIIIFSKIVTYKKFTEEIKQKEMEIGEDVISIAGLFHIIKEEPLFLIWVCVDPQQPIVHRFNEFNRNKMLLINDGKSLKLYQDDYEHWCFIQKNLIVSSSVPSKFKKLNDEMKKKKCEEHYFKEKAVYDLNTLKQIAIDQTLNTQLILTFGSGNLRILFGCDQGREQFKYSLMKSVSINQFKLVNQAL